MAIKSIFYFLVLALLSFFISQAGMAENYCTEMCSQICDNFYKNQGVNLKADAREVNQCIETCMEDKCD